MSDIRVTVESGKTKRLLTKGKLCDKNIVVTAEGGSVDDRYDEGYEDGRNQGYGEGWQGQYDAFWDTYQQNGTRTEYAYGFAGFGWTDETFRPKYDIKPKESIHLLSGCRITDFVTALNKAGVKLDLSIANNTGYLMQPNKYTTTLPTLDLTARRNIDHLFYSATALQYIEKIILKSDGSQGFNAYSFREMPALEEVRFEGSIGKSLEIKDSPLLSVASVQSIIDHLKDLTGGTTQTLTLHETVGASLTDEQIVAIGVKNWTLVYGGQTISVFYVGGSSKFSYAVKGVPTWAEFVDSAYNVDGIFKIENSKVSFNDPVWGWFEIYGVAPSDTILLGNTYTP